MKPHTAGRAARTPEPWVVRTVSGRAGLSGRLRRMGRRVRAALVKKTRILKRPRWKVALCALLLATVPTALAVGLFGLGGCPAFLRHEQGGATIAPQATEAPARTPEPVSAPEDVLAPTPGNVPTPAPTSTPVPDAPPTLSIPDRVALAELYWWMIHSGTKSVDLQSMALDAAEIFDLTDKFSNYFSAYSYDADTGHLKVVFKAGLEVLHAIRTDRIEALDDDLQTVAARAQAAVAELTDPDMTDLEKELALHDYLVERCRYLAHVPGDDTGDARGFFLHGLCHCAGYVDAFRLLGQLAGLEVEMIGGPTTRDAEGGKGHAWNLIRLDGLWYVVDPTWDDMIAGTPTVEHTFFNLPFSCFAGSRSWDGDVCPPGDYAGALDENYYYNRPIYVADEPRTIYENAVSQIEDGGLAYVLFAGEDLSQRLEQALEDRYGADVECLCLSGDLDIALYRYSR